MASSRGTLNGPDLLDFTESLKAFQEQNSIEVRVELSLSETYGHTDLVAVLTAWGRDERIQDQVILASLNVTCSATKYKSLDTALFRALYALDSHLAWLEMGKPDRRS